MKTLSIPVLLSLLVSGTAHCQQVNITQDLERFQVRHGKQEVTIIRNQDTGATLDTDFALTSRPCPPFCAQPMQVSPGVKTIGEVELVGFMQTHLADDTGVLIDARTEEWYKRGTIPGSINIPFTHLHPGQGADDITLEDAWQSLV